MEAVAKRDIFGRDASLVRYFGDAATWATDQQDINAALQQVGSLSQELQLLAPDIR